MIPPPTPTLIPNVESGGAEGMPILDFPSAWELAPEAVQTWNQFGSATLALQAIIIAAIIGLGIYLLIRFFRSITGEKNE